MKAVVFDLWDTLVEWPVAEAEVLKQRIAELVPHEHDEFERRWREGYRMSQTGPLADAYRALGLPDEHVESQPRMTDCAVHGSFVSLPTPVALAASQLSRR